MAVLGTLQILTHKRNMKVCKKCGKEKNETEFSGSMSSGKFYLKTFCKSCTSEVVRDKNKWFAALKENPNRVDPIEKVDPAKRGRPKNKNYCNNDDLLAEVVRCKLTGEMSRELVKMFGLIVDNSSRKLKYRDDRDRQDVKQNAWLKICKYWTRFDPARSNQCFSYFTQISKFAFAEGFNQLHNKDMQMTSLDNENITYLI